MNQKLLKTKMNYARWNELQENPSPNSNLANKKYELGSAKISNNGNDIKQGQQTKCTCTWRRNFEMMMKILKMTKTRKSKEEKREGKKKNPICVRTIWRFAYLWVVLRFKNTLKWPSLKRNPLIWEPPLQHMILFFLLCQCTLLFPYKFLSFLSKSIDCFSTITFQSLFKMLMQNQH
jgi:hypothetical protein